MREAHRIGWDRSGQCSMPLRRRDYSHIHETRPVTPRERQVWELTAHGATRTEMAAALGISEHTLRNHVQALHVKLGVTTAAELACLWFGGALHHAPEAQQCSE